MNTELKELLLQGLEVTGLGLAGVFGALIAFYIMIVLLAKIPVKNTNENENQA
ncbi:MAG: OadG family protein [Acetivibrionales bacterium]|jgi:formate hydrogenlyase subunit 4|nr:oxaloacetate decarboxylase [Clostridiaceae bacterium]